MTNSLWVVQDRETKHFWNGFGYTPNLHEARTYPNPPMIEEWVPTPVDVLELRLIVKEELE